MRKVFLTLSLSFFLLSTGLHAAAQESTPAPDGWPVEQRCVGEPTAPPQGWTYPGTILMRGSYGIHAIQAGWSTTHVVAFIRLRDTLPGGAGLSPDGQWYATVDGYIPAIPWGGGNNYEYFVTAIHVYSTSDPGTQFVLPWDNSFLERWGDRQMRWLDSENLVYESSDSMDKPDFEKMFVINPFTRSVHSWQGHVDPLDNRVGQYLSPDWKWTIYRTEVITWGLYDIASGNRMADLPLTGNPAVAWKPDATGFASELAQSDHSSLVLFDANGSYHNTLFDLSAEKRVGLADIGWSEDGRYLATIVFNRADSSYGYYIPRNSLYIVDTQEQRVFDTCLAIGYGLGWSPANDAIAIMSPGEGEKQVMVMDINSWKLYSITSHLVGYNQGIIGWRTND